MSHYSLDAVRSSARGAWPSILPTFGIDSRSLVNRHGPCPGCGGKDRFRFDDKDGHGSYFCGGGGDPTSGDGISLIQHVTNLPFPSILKELGDYLRVTPVERRTAPKQPSSTQAYALQIWAKARREDATVASHPYCLKKGITCAGGAGRAEVSGRLVGKSADCVIVPNRRLSGELVGVECINSDGLKQSFGRKGVMILGNDLDESSDQPRLVVEGWATGMKSWDILGNACVYVTFGKGKAPALLTHLCQQYPERVFLLGEEDDD